MFLFVSLREPERDVASYVSRAAESGPREWLRELRRAFSPRDRRLLKVVRARARAGARRPGARAAGGLSCRSGRRAASSCSGSSGARSAAASASREIDGLHEPRALVFERNGEAVLAPLEGDVLRWMDCYVEHEARRAAGRVRARHAAGRRSSCSARCPSGATFPGARAELMFAPRREPAVRDRPLAERALPAERAGAADRAPAHPGRRPDRAGRVRRRAGRLRPRLSAHPGGARPARLPAGLEPPAAAARDARDRRGRARRGGAGGARGDVSGAPTARSVCTGRSATSCSCSSSTCRASARAWPATTTR